MNSKPIELKPFNSFQVNATATRLTEITSVTQLKKAIKSDGLNKFVLGGGSNVLFTKHLHAHILLNRIQGIKVIKETPTYVDVSVGGGVEWHRFILWTLEQNFSGLENLSLIPGMVGAAPIQNIGAYGVEQKDCFIKLEALDLRTGKVHEFTHRECDFGYRDSIFKKDAKLRFCIIRVCYRLQRVYSPHISYGAIKVELEQSSIVKPSARDVSKAIIKIRQSKLPDPKKLGNAGSFFKNPVISNAQFLELKQDYPNMPSYPISDLLTKVPAGWLIEQCGWKGKRVGLVGCYEKQALVIVNYGESNGRLIQQHALNIKKSVYTQFGINLQNEVNIF